MGRVRQTSTSAIVAGTLLAVAASLAAVGSVDPLRWSARDDQRIEPLVMIDPITADRVAPAPASQPNVGSTVPGDPRTSGYPSFLEPLRDAFPASWAGVAPFVGLARRGPPISIP